jgi:arginine/lysine/ornithine decarboxylase
MVQSGRGLLGAALDLAGAVREELAGTRGLHVLEKELVDREASHDLDRLQVLIDVSELGISGYQAADWLREHARLDVGLSDHRRILVTLSMADDDTTTARLRSAVDDLVTAAPELPRQPPVRIPMPSELELESVMSPREAFFGPVEHVPAEAAIGRIAAEQVTPYPPGIAVMVPGERINAEVVEYLRSGLQAGMVLPDATDPTLETFRVRASH